MPAPAAQQYDMAAARIGSRVGGWVGLCSHFGLARAWLGGWCSHLAVLPVDLTGSVARPRVLLVGGLTPPLARWPDPVPLIAVGTQLRVQGSPGWWGQPWRWTWW